MFSYEAYIGGNRLNKSYVDGYIDCLVSQTKLNIESKKQLTFGDLADIIKHKKLIEFVSAHFAIFISDLYEKNKDKNEEVFIYRCIATELEDDHTETHSSLEELERKVEKGFAEAQKGVVIRICEDLAKIYAGKKGE